MGLWATTSHRALMPQTPIQGSAHFRLMQARLGAHSLLMTHSGLQPGGGPKYPGGEIYLDLVGIFLCEVFTWQTGTDGVVAVHSAVGVGSTGGRSAGIHWLQDRSPLGCEGTLDEGVSHVALVTFTDGVVVGHSTAGVDTTGAGAGVETLGVDTGLVLGTVVAQQTLRFALHCGISLVVPDTLTHCLPTLYSAVSVDTAGVGVAGISGDGRYRGHGLHHTPGEGISHSSRGTTTDGVVLSDLTHGAHSTGPGAGVDTLLGDAGQPGAAVRVLETLGLTALTGDGVSLVAGPAGTEHLASSVLTALSVGATGRGLAGVGRDAALEGVPSEAGIAPAVLSDVVNQTLRVVSTRPGLAQRHYGLLRPDGDTALDGVDGLGVAGPAGAALDVVHHHALGVGSARVGLAGLHWADTGDGRGVSFVSRQTETHRAVSDHPAAGVGAALVPATLGAVVDTADEGVAGLTPGTGTDGVAVVQLTQGVDTTGRGVAGVGEHRGGGAANISIALEPGLAGTDGVVVGRTADGVVSTETRAHQDTFPLESVAVLVLRTVRVQSTF